MIYVAVIRRAVCEICDGVWDLEAEEPVPDRCIHCASRDWLFGREALDSTFVRMRISRERIEKNPGAKARNRQERGKSQYRSFHPKPVDEDEEAQDN